MSEKSVLELAAEFQGNLRGAARKGRGTAKLSGWPLRSAALAVHPKRRQEAIDDARAKGVPTEFTLKGEPVFTSRNHQRQYCQAYGYHNQDDSWSGRHG